MIVGILVFLLLFNNILAQACCTVSCPPPKYIQRSRLYVTGHEQLGMQLLDAAKEFNPDRFNALFRRIENEYLGDKQDFLRIMQTVDQDGYNVLMFSALIGDLTRLAWLLYVVKKILGPQPELVYELFKPKVQEENLLGLGVYNADRRIVNLILTYAIDLLDHRPDLFYLFINAGESGEGWKPLVDASDDALSEIIKMMVISAKKVLGFKSELFEKFINAEDAGSFTALKVAQSFDDILFLRNNGAIEKGKAEKGTKFEESLRYRRALSLGKKMIEASNRSDFKAFKDTLNLTLNEFKGDESALYTFFYARDDAGWNVLIHTAADGQYEYIKLVLEAIEKSFKDKTLKSLIISNVDFEGRTALHLAIARRHFDIAHLLMKTLMDYSKDKPLLYTLINSPDQLSGFTPFMFLVYITGEYDPPAFEFLQHMLQHLASFFNRNSRIFGRIINTRDYNGWNVLAYASGHKVSRLLQSYGAIDVPETRIPILSKYFERFVVEPGGYMITPFTAAQQLGKPHRERDIIEGY